MADNKLSDKMSTPEVSRNNLEYIESIPQLEMAEQPQYRMYRRRWAGLAALVRSSADTTNLFIRLMERKHLGILKHHIWDELDVVQRYSH